jgi:transcriptional regulator with XRE-family HTH domain
MNEYKNILDNIFHIRTLKGLSQDYVANELNLSQSGYMLIEKGKRELKYDTLLQIAIAFKMDVIDIITYPNKVIQSKEEDLEAILQIKLKRDKKDQVLRIVFGDNNLEILNK